LFILTHAFGFDSLRSKWNAPIFLNQQEERKKELMVDLEEKDRKIQHRYLGMIRFFGELFMVSMLTVGDMYKCVERLLSGYKKTKDEVRLECFCTLLATIGARMDEQALDGYPEGFSIYLGHQVKTFKV
jgi:ABC-type dipeptide/oligopeptide/nickel transport system ATPase component